jgi:hypothetical protein
MMKLTLTMVAALAALSTLALAGDAPERFDVAEDHTRFVFAPTPVHDDGLPAYGNAFVTQGYVYEAGTLDGGHEGVNPDGSPAFPDRVIGTWTCDGWYVGNGFHTKAGTILISRQVFEFADGSILISQGPDSVDENIPLPRAITGGTGEFAGIGEEMSQTLLGMRDGFGVRLQFEVNPDWSDTGQPT